MSLNVFIYSTSTNKGDSLNEISFIAANVCPFLFLIFASSLITAFCKGILYGSTTI